MPLVEVFDPTHYQGNDRLAHIETYVKSLDTWRKNADFLSTAVVPLASPTVATATAMSASGTASIVRAVVPRGAQIINIYAYVAASGGNACAAIYDTSATTRNALWKGASTSASTANAWLNLGSPLLEVTTGMHLDLFLVADGTTATFGATTLGGANAAQLPTAFDSANGLGGHVFLAATYANVFTPPNTLTESTYTAATSAKMILCQLG